MTSFKALGPIEIVANGERRRSGLISNLPSRSATHRWLLDRFWLVVIRAGLAAVAGRDEAWAQRLHPPLASTSQNSAPNTQNLTVKRRYLTERDAREELGKLGFVLAVVNQHRPQAFLRLALGRRYV